ncbi:hypothetical protein CS379_06030, partial [Methylobacterium frigidaeris]
MSEVAAGAAAACVFFDLAPSADRCRGAPGAAKTKVECQSRAAVRIASPSSQTWTARPRRVG